jgi:hypothetical protein
LEKHVRSWDIQGKAAIADSFAKFGGVVSGSIKLIEKGNEIRMDWKSLGLVGFVWIEFDEAEK